MKIRTQFALALCGMVAASFAIAVYVGTSYVGELKSNLISLHGHTHADVLRAVAERRFGTSRQDTIGIYLKLVRKIPGIEAAYVVGPDGAILFHDDNLYVGQSAEKYRAVLGKDSLSFAQPVDLGRAGAGAVRVDMSKNAYFSAFARAHRRLLPRAAALACGAVVAGFGLALITAFFITRPLERLVQGAQQVSRGNLAAEVPSAGARELAELSKQFNDMTRRLRELDELKDEWISSVSHDLRSPLAAIKIYADFMLHDAPERAKIAEIAPNHQEMVSIIADNAMRLGVFVSNILDAAKIKAGRMEHHPQAVAVEQALDNVRALFAMMAQQRGVQLLSDAAAGLRPVHVDPERFERVLFNLVANSLKFTGKGGCVTLGARADGESVEVFVADTGKGIPEELQKHLFERYYQADEARQKAERVQGTGLGLYIVKQTVEEMGGRIHVDSQAGVGTRVTLRVPACAGEEA